VASGKWPTTSARRLELREANVLGLGTLRPPMMLPYVLAAPAPGSLVAVSVMIRTIPPAQWASVAQNGPVGAEISRH
jgi:hypothetical protein